MYHAKNGRLSLDHTDLDYVRFGTGERILIMLPGLSDGLRTVKGTALSMAVLYRHFAKAYTVYVFSRKNLLPPGYTTRDMAADQKRAMDLLGIRRADVLGVSMGGMIAQHLAAEYPDAVGKLVLAVTAAKSNPVLSEAVTGWMEQARQGGHTALMDSSMKSMYSSAYYRKNKWFVPVVAALSRPKSYDRFLIQADACLTHDALHRLPLIHSPTLVIGGEQDLVATPEASRELHAHIPNAQLRMYPQWGHALYEEEKTFNETALRFLLS